MTRQLVPGKRTVVIWKEYEFELPEGHSATWIGEAELPAELEELSEELLDRVRTEPDDRSIVLLSDGYGGGAYSVGDVDENDERVRVLLTGMVAETGHASGGRVVYEPTGYPFPGEDE